MSLGKPSALAQAAPAASRLFVAYFLALAVLVLGLLAAFLATSYRQTREMLERVSRDEAGILANEMVASLRRIDANSAYLVERARPILASGTITTAQEDELGLMLDMLSRQFPEAMAYRVFKADGTSLLGRDAPQDTLRIDDRRFFQALKAHPDDRLRFSETLAAKTTGTPAVIAHRAVLGVAGEFLGVIAAPIDLRHFSREFSGLAVGKTGMVSVRRSDDSRLVVRWPDVPDEVNKPADQTPPYQMLRAGQREGVVRYVGKTDGVDRIFAFRQVEGYPFYVLVGRAVEEQFAGWRHTAALATTLTLSALVLLSWFLHSLRRRDLTLRASEARFRAIADAQPDAVCRWLPDTTITTPTPSTARGSAPRWSVGAGLTTSPRRSARAQMPVASVSPPRRRSTSTTMPRPSSRAPCAGSTGSMCRCSTNMAAASSSSRWGAM